MLDSLWALEESAFARLMPALQQKVELKQEIPGGTSIRTVAAKGDKAIALIPITGVMTKGQSWYSTSTIRARQDIRAAAADPRISSILLVIDSPGGSVSGTGDLASEVRAARKAKPVWAHGDDLVASAAYWVASQASALFINHPTAQVGSIGTLATMTDVSAMAERSGVKVHVFRTGPLKGAGTPGAPVTGEQLDHMQRLVEQTQESFSAAVRAGRHLSDARLAKVSTGGVWLAPEALGLGLIDGVRPLAETVAELSKAK